MRPPATSANVVHVAVDEPGLRSQPWRPPALDALLALGLATLVQLEIWGSDVTVPKTLAVPVALLMTLPLAWRRRFPLAVVAVVMGALAVQSVLDSSEQPPQTPFLALVAAVYSVAAYTDRTPALIGGGISLVVILVSQPDDFIVAGPLYTGSPGRPRSSGSRRRRRGWRSPRSAPASPGSCTTWSPTASA